LFYQRSYQNRGTPSMKRLSGTQVLLIEDEAINCVDG